MYLIGNVIFGLFSQNPEKLHVKLTVFGVLRIYSISFEAVVSDFFLKKKHVLQIVCYRLIWNPFWNILFGFLMRDVQSFDCVWYARFPNFFWSIFNFFSKKFIFSYNLKSCLRSAWKITFFDAAVQKWQHKILIENSKFLKNVFSEIFFFYFSGINRQQNFEWRKN
jgi:hypothetical protein